MYIYIWIQDPNYIPHAFYKQKDMVVPHGETKCNAIEWHKCNANKWHILVKCNINENNLWTCNAIEWLDTKM